jgi:hypothetical protein
MTGAASMEKRRRGMGERGGAERAEEPLFTDARGVDVNETPPLPAVLELYDPRDLGEEGVVLASPHVLTGKESGAALADENGASRDGLTAEGLDAEALRVAVPPVA